MAKERLKFISFLAPFAACASLILASLANFLVHNDYPLLRPEVLIVVSAIIALSAVAATLYLILPRWGRSLFEGLLAALFIELNTTSLSLAVLAGVGVAAMTFWKAASATRPMALFGAIVLVTTLLGLGAAPRGSSLSVGEERRLRSTQPSRPSCTLYSTSISASKAFPMTIPMRSGCRRN